MYSLDMEGFYLSILLVYYFFQLYICFKMMSKHTGPLHTQVGHPRVEIYFGVDKPFRLYNK